MPVTITTVPPFSFSLAQSAVDSQRGAVPALGLTRKRGRRSPRLLGSELVMHLMSAAEPVLGHGEVEDILTATGLGPMMVLGDVVAEERIAALHRHLHETHPEHVAAIMQTAGGMTADMSHAADVSERARTMLKTAPWPIAAWLVSKTIMQSSWIFAGTGEFRVRRTLDFDLRDNPLTRDFRSSRPVCHWHRGYLGRLYRLMVHPQLECYETACCATGSDTCRFEIRLSSGQSLWDSAGHL